MNGTLPRAGGVNTHYKENDFLHKNPYLTLCAKEGKINTPGIFTDFALMVSNNVYISHY
jgi:hypothetical protein